MIQKIVKHVIKIMMQTTLHINGRASDSTADRFSPKTRFALCPAVQTDLIWIVGPSPLLTAPTSKDHFAEARRKKGGLEALSGPSNKRETQLEWITRIAQHRDRAAFGELFAYFAPRVKSFLIKQGLNSDKAEDLAQDVMVIVWQKAEQFDPDKAGLSTWIFRIARNKFIDHTRKQKYPEVNADDHVASLVAPDQTDRPVQTLQDVNRIQSALTKLSPDQKKVIELSFFEELSHSQISDFLNVPLGTVKSRIRIAFNVLRKELGEI